MSDSGEPTTKKLEHKDDQDEHEDEHEDKHEHEYADYTVAWMCSRPLEAAAARTMLDKVHPKLAPTAADQNIYALGEISGLNVVIVCLPSGSGAPGTGTISPAILASQTLAAFEGLKYGVMVGIGSGIPKTVGGEMWLGDVVVAKPTPKGTMGIIAYDSDSGKTVNEPESQLNVINNRIPRPLLNALSAVQSDNDSESLEIASSVSQALDGYPEMLKQFSMPDRTTDELFEAEYSHPPDEPDCLICEDQYLVDRTPPESDEPRVHYGLIASGGEPLRDSAARDRLADENGALCYETEAFELIDQVSFLVIRGICDYGDSHQSERWQGYAAMTAAAYAKILVSRVRPSNMMDYDELDSSLALPLFKEMLFDEALGESDEASSLVDKLGCLPLAIMQAAGYINENQISVNEYLSLLDCEDESVLETGQDFGDDCKNPIIKTWLVSLREIQKVDSLATRYLSIMSCLAPAWIPLSLLPAAKSNARQQIALGRLKAYYFIMEHSEIGTRFFSLPRLVRKATRNWLNSQDRLNHWINEAGQH